MMARPMSQAVQFRLWAPACDRVELVLDGEPAPLKMKSASEGWHELTTPLARHGTRYRFRLPDGMLVPDPASRYQPEDVHGPSEVIDTATWQWSDTAWRGRPWREVVMYELHIGAFTAEGTFRSAIAKLDHLAQLGVTAIEIMPIVDFPGLRNWGYDGVLPYAVDSAYGRPEDFKTLVEAAHARGILMLLDVVYNHFGPEGNYLSLYAPRFFTDRHRTPWGPGLNFDGAGCRAVREFVIHNALYWLREFHLDGLRIDAVHAIFDDSPVHILEELAARVRSEITDRHIHLILENERNEPRWLRHGLYTAQWNDAAHHVLHTAITGEDHRYYAKYVGDTHKLGRALAEGFVSGGRGLRSDAFIAFLQNHDQTGNRAFGERIGALAPAEAVRAAAAVYLLLPQIPMLFMGEEWNASTPFPFFCDFAGELAERVRQGRRAEFGYTVIPDPQSAETFASAKLDWKEAARNRETIEWYRRILAVRREHITPQAPGEYEVIAAGAVVVRWPSGLTLAANLSPVPVPLPSTRGDVIWQEGTHKGTWRVVWSRA
jgi:malto-oligosyltrehalose trehalohydrolase